MNKFKICKNIYGCREIRDVTISSEIIICLKLSSCEGSCWAQFDAHNIYGDVQM